MSNGLLNRQFFGFSNEMLSLCFSYTSFLDVGGRFRRDAPKTLDKNLQNVLSSIETLTDFVQKQSNGTFQREIHQALEKFFTNLPSKEVCKRFLTQCGCKGATLFSTPLPHSPTTGIFLLVCPGTKIPLKL